MTEKHFDVAPPDGDKDDAPTPSGDASAPADAPKPKSNLHRPTAERTSGSRGRPIRRKPSKQRPEPSAPATAGLPLFFRPSFLLVAGAVVLAVLWGGGLFGPGGAAWPWEQFQSDGGAFTFSWDGAHASALIGALFALFFLFAPFGPRIRSRGGAVLAVAALGLVTLPALGLPGRVAVLAGLGGAAILGREGLRGRIGGRAFLFVLVLLLAAGLFYPIGPSSTTYQALGANLIEEVFSGGDLGDLLLRPQTVMLLMAILLLVVGILAWLGFGGTWAVWVGGIALYLVVLGPMGVAFYNHLQVADPVTCAGSLRAVVAGLPAGILAFVLPVAAGAMDLSRP